MTRSAMPSRIPVSQQRGVAAVELALSMLPLIVLLFGVSEFGRMMFTFNALDKSVRDAARFITAPPSTSTDPEGDAARLAVFGNTAGNPPALAPGLTVGHVTFCNRTTCPGTHQNQDTGSGPINLVTVNIVGYQYSSIITYVAPARVQFNNISVTMRANL